MKIDGTLAFGPVPSRRLGRSLGINNIPPKRCTYSCVYCQLGHTVRLQVDREPFYRPERILDQVRDRVESVREKGERVDYITFVPQGEPTLEVNLGREIEALKPLGIKVAVISNGSLVWKEDVREALQNADWVSLKVDTVGEETWRRVNRPHGRLELKAILEGMLSFARDYDGALATETMLVQGLNDGESSARELAEFLGRLGPHQAYVSIPTRPPAELWVHAPEEETINRTYQIISQKVNRAEYLIGYEGNAFSSTGRVEEDLLSITAVHPMRAEAVRDLIDGAGADWSAVRALVTQDQLVEVDYGGHQFYMRRVNRRDGGQA